MINLPVVFRCNVSSVVGIGHLMRCFELARVLHTNGHKLGIMGPDKSYQTNEALDLFDFWWPVDNRLDDYSDSMQFLSLCSTMGAQHAIMDDYRITLKYQIALQKAGIRWIQQFDASNPFEFIAPLVVNASPYEKAEQYQNYKKNHETKFLFGPKYSVLRQEFLLVDAPEYHRSIRRVLITFGGGNDKGMVDSVLDALVCLDLLGITIVVVTGLSNPRNSLIEQRLKELEGYSYEFYISTSRMASLMSGCDLAVIAGGTLSYEAAICNLPFLTIAIASNQERPCKGWFDISGSPFIGVATNISTSDIAQSLIKVISNDDFREDIARKNREAVDGMGAERLIESLMDNVSTFDL